MIGNLGGFTALEHTTQELPGTRICGIALPIKNDLTDNSGSRGRLRCVICTLGFHSMPALHNHFKVCAQKFRNSSGVCFDADVSCKLVKELVAALAPAGGDLPKKPTGRSGLPLAVDRPAFKIQRSKKKQAPESVKSLVEAQSLVVDIVSYGE